MTAEDSDRALQRPVVLAVVVATALALLARFALLGARVAHWDEARVGYWILDFMATGDYYYRPIIHGPFYHHVNSVVFSLFGASDFSMRVVAALVGGLLPLSALLFRERLRGPEVAALAFLLAANPILLYYSRFMRGDVVVGAFSFLAFALVVRGLDTREPWYLLPASVSMALGFTAKENSLVYLVAWLGAAVLTVDHRLLVARGRGTDWLAGERLERAAGALRRSAGAIAASVVAALAVVVFFYAPRGDVPSDGTFYRYCNPGADHVASMDGAVGFGDLLANPGAIPDVVLVATVGTLDVMTCQWIGGATGSEGNPYLEFFGDLVGTVAYGAGVIAVLAVVGFLVDRYGDGRPRDLVMFAFYWGVLSLAGYPIVTDIKAPWAAVHVVLPLAIPAAVGAGLLFRWGSESLADDDRVSVAIAVGLALLLVGQMGGMAVHPTYVAPQSADNELVQYAQPAGELQPTLRDMAALSAENEGPDVLLYGTEFVDGDDSATREPACAKWFDTLPLPWYWEKDDVNVTCTTDAEELNATVESDRPPVVIARSNHRENLSRSLDGYEARTYLLRSFDTETVFFLDREALDAAGDR